MNTDTVMDWVVGLDVGTTVTVRKTAEALGMVDGARLDVVRRGLVKAVKWGYAVRVTDGPTVLYIRCERYADPEQYDSACTITRTGAAYEVVGMMACGEEITSEGLYRRMESAGSRLNLISIREVLSRCTADGLLVRRRAVSSSAYIYTRTTKGVAA